MVARAFVGACVGACAAGAALGGCATAGARGADGPGAPPIPDPRAVQPERPSVATPASTVAPGIAELETGGDRGDEGVGTILPTVLKIGLAPRLQLSLFLPAEGGAGTPFGPGDVGAGVKWRAIDGHRVLGDVALLPQVTLPTGGPRGTGTAAGSLLLINSHAFGPLTLDLNLGATARGGDGTRAPRLETLWTVSASRRGAGRLGWGLECFGYPGTSGAAGEAPTVALLTGPTFALRPTLVLDAGVIAPVRGPHARAVFVGLVTHVGRLR